MAVVKVQVGVQVGVRVRAPFGVLRHHPRWRFCAMMVFHAGNTVRGYATCATDPLVTAASNDYFGPLVTTCDHLQLPCKPQ